MPASQLTDLLWKGMRETLYMTLWSTALAYLIGLPMGVLLVVTDKEGLRPLKGVNVVLGIIINLARSIPFLILLIAVIPLTRAIVGKMVGSTATIVPLTLSAAPFIARIVESSLKEVDSGVVQAARAMGASPMQIIWKVLLMEAKPSLLLGAAIAITTILGYSAMAGIVGGGGLGDIAIRYGYYRYQTDTMLITVALLVVVVQLFQEIGARAAKRIDRRL
ncbi:methionine ABC transporter permease [Clostridia bacterium]|nr:methionine ABC transporter permease [Clostridia bacterium]